MKITTTSKPILLAWEHGRNLGHIGRLLAIARLIEAQGCEPIFAVPAQHLHSPLLAKRHVATSIQPSRAPANEQGNRNAYRRCAAPAMHPTEAQAATRADSFADILMSLGFADAAALSHAVSAWLQLFQAVQPASVVLDYAPAAQLAALLINLPAFQITNGFDAPSSHCPVFAIGMRGPYLDNLNAQKLYKISAAMAQTAKDVMGQTAPTLDAYFTYPTKVYDCIPEVDPYGPRTDGLYVGPIAHFNTLQAAIWPNAQPAQPVASTQPSRPRVFAYLRTQANALDWLQALHEVEADTLCVWPDAPDDVIQNHSHGNLHITRQPVHLPQALAQADAVVNYGSAAMVCHTLLAGKPQLMLPQDMEKILVAAKVVETGAGLVAGAKPGNCTQLLNQLLHDPRLTTAARGIAARYPTAHLLDNRDLFVHMLCAEHAAPNRQVLNGSSAEPRNGHAVGMER